MNIVYITDNNFAQHTGISMLSLFENNKDIKDINVFIADNGIDSKNKKYLAEIAQRYSRNITYSMALEVLEKNLDERTKKQVLTYYGTLVGCLQFMMDKLFPELDICLYIDSDTLIEGSLSELDSFDMSDCIIAAVASPGTLNSPEIQERELASRKKYYYNTGVMLINLQRWRAENSFNEICQCLYSNNSFCYGAQSIINSAFSDEQIKPLPLKFNYWGFLYPDKKRINILSGGGYYSLKEIEIAVSSPVIIHFKGNYYRPWFKECNKNIYTEKYLKYKSQTGWKNVAPISIYKTLYNNCSLPKNMKFRYQYFWLLTKMKLLGNKWGIDIFDSHFFKVLKRLKFSK